MSGDDSPVVELSGSGLSLETFVRLARDPTYKVGCEGEALNAVKRGRERVDDITRAYADRWETLKDDPDATSKLGLVYGVTTGFGEFKRVPIPPKQLEEIQRNILLSHATGIGGDPNELNLANYFPAEVVRGALILRLNTFLKGHSGVRVDTIEYIRAMLNCGIIPLVPLRGSVGSSGDLCPLAHLFSVLLGEGRYYVVKDPSDMDASQQETRVADERLYGDLKQDKWFCAEVAGGRIGVPFTPASKEGLALTNGATFCAADLALAVSDAETLASVADVAAAMSFESVCGRVRCLDEKVHKARGLPGQIASAENLRELLTGSEEIEKADEVQDLYSLRCAPQVHGATRDAIAFARMIVDKEINATTDNPLFFPGREPWDLAFRAANQEGDGRHEPAYSAGNFHGQPVGLAADFLAIAVAELADISERRVQMLLDANHNRNLPANLIPNRGVNCGLMIAQYCAAGLVSENKVLCHPASVDSIPTSANTEDHVSMASIASRKLRTVVHNAQAVLAIELMCAAQAIEWRVGMAISPNEDGKPQDKQKTPRAERARKASEEADAFRLATQKENRGKIAMKLGRGSGPAYLAIRKVAAPITEDCTLDGRIRQIWSIVRDGELVKAVNDELGRPLRPIPALLAPLVE